MNLKKQKKRYMIMILSLLAFITMITLFYSYFELGESQDWEETWIVILVLMVLFYGVPSLVVGQVLFYRLKSALRRKEEIQIRKEVHGLSLRSTLTMIVASGLFFVLLILPDYMDGSLRLIDQLNILITLAYINVIFPCFLIYMLSSHIQSHIKVDLYHGMSMELQPQKTRISYLLILLIMVCSIYPLTILFLDVLAFYNPERDQGFLVFGVIDIVMFAICIIIGLGVIIRSLTSPLYRLLQSFSEIKQGNFTTRVPVASKGEIGRLSYNYNLMATELEKREKVKSIFGQYVSPGIAQHILEREEALKGEERIVTVLFTDIQGYTSITESLSPSETIAMMNQYYESLIPLVHRHEGTVNKFIGDALMVMFNAPKDDPDHALHALECGQEIIKVTSETFFMGKHLLKTRVGINTGPAIAGRLGGEGRYEYTLLGDTVNLAQRLESLNKKTGTTLLFSDTTAKALPEGCKVKAIGKTKVKGKTQSTGIYSTPEEVEKIKSVLQ